MNDCMVRAALSGDMQEVFAIRNHPATRVFSSNQDELAWDAHVAWFTRQYLIPSPHRCYVLDCDDRVVGYCRFDARDDGGYAVSIALDPTFRGKGLGRLLLGRAMEAFGHSRGLYAEVLKKNAVSHKLFEEAGFVLDAEDTKAFILRKRGIGQDKTP